MQEASCEEFIDGEEFTFDTVCIAGKPAYMNVAQYLPKPLIARNTEWISPVIITVRDLAQSKMANGIALGHKVLDALGMGDGFTHMEWFRKPDGEAVFGEIGCRPGGAHIVDQMNYTCDIDLFREWARVVCWGHFEAPTPRKYNAAIIFKRAKGAGASRKITGLREFMRDHGEHVVEEQLLPAGAMRRNWKHTLLSDGSHPAAPSRLEQGEGTRRHRRHRNPNVRRVGGYDPGSQAAEIMQLLAQSGRCPKFLRPERGNVWTSIVQGTAMSIVRARAGGINRRPSMLPLWIGFFAFVLALLALDLGVFHRDSHEMKAREAIGWTLAWISVGVAFGGLVYFMYEHHWFGAGTGKHAQNGSQATSAYFTAYVLEKSLSVDNIFVMSLIFTSLKIRPEFQRRILFWGILGALFFRTIMISGGVWLIEHFSFTFYVFGGILLFSGVRMLVSAEDEDEEGWFVRAFKRILPIAPGDHGDRFRARVNGRLMLTQLSLALIAIELTDVIFAFDSVPAVLAISTDPFLVVTSNVFAILGLRSLYFVLARMMNQFHYLQVALAFLLIIIGAKLFAHDWLHVPNQISLLVVLGVVSLGILASLLSKK